MECTDVNMLPVSSFQVAFDVMPVSGDGFEQYHMVCWLPQLHSTVWLPRA